MKPTPDTSDVGEALSLRRVSLGTFLINPNHRHP